jgi:predicted protein tyrosine phosphatase
MIKPFVENISFKCIQTGFHYDPGINSMLIQIVDPGTEFPKPEYQFRFVRQYTFLDEEDPTKPGAITSEIAELIVSDLKLALKEHTNVIVHCHAGICRSGAVAEVAIMLGFRDTEVHRQPNLLVKQLLISKI